MAGPLSWVYQGGRQEGSLGLFCGSEVNAGAHDVTFSLITGELCPQSRNSRQRGGHPQPRWCPASSPPSTQNSRFLVAARF